MSESGQSQCEAWIEGLMQKLHNSDFMSLSVRNMETSKETVPANLPFLNINLNLKIFYETVQEKYIFEVVLVKSLNS